MKKKTYISPTIKVHSFDIQEAILIGSGDGDSRYTPDDHIDNTLDIDSEIRDKDDDIVISRWL